MSKEGNFTNSHLLREFVKNYEQNQSSKIKNIGLKGVTYTPSQIVNSMILNTFYWYFTGIFPNLKIKKSDFSIQNLFENIKEKENRTRLLKILRNIKILDPSAGTGRFLLNLSKFLFEIFIKLKNSPDSLNLKRKIIEDNLYGYEINKKSCFITKIQLLNWLFQGEKDLFSGDNLDFTSIKQTIKNEQIKFHIFHTDYLLDEFKDQRFDIIIGNPPYVENKEINKDYKKKLYPSFQSAYKLFDLSILFIEKSINLLKDSNSINSFILPNKFLAADYAVKIREIILKKCRIRNLINLSSLNLFNGVSAYPIILTLQKKINQEKSIISIEDFKNENPHSRKNFGERKFSQHLIESLPKKVIPLEGDPELVVSIYKAFNSMEDEIKDLSIIYRPYGFLNYQRFLNYISNQMNSPDDLILLGTGNVGKYFIKFDKNLRLGGKSYSVAHFSDEIPPKKSIGSLDIPKIIFREIAKNLTFVFDPGIFTNLTGLYFIKIPHFSELELFSLVGILNSSFLNYIFKTLYTTLQMSGKYMRINGSFIRRLPIPNDIPNSIGLLSKINHFLNQLNYDYEKLKIMNPNLNINFNTLNDDLLPFFNEITDSLVKFLYLSGLNPTIKFPHISNFLYSNNKFPDICFKYNLNRFNLKKYKSYALKCIEEIISKLEKFYKNFITQEEMFSEIEKLQNDY